MNKRVSIFDDIGTVRYEGPLLHKESEATDIWLGIEWDVLERGKHDGTV